MLSMMGMVDGIVGGWVVWVGWVGGWVNSAEYDRYSGWNGG